jgi:hypothetical protein
VSGPGLTAAAITKHFPESKETIKGHARNTPSGLRSTKQRQANSIDNNDNDEIPTVKYRNIFIKVYRVNNDNALHNMYSNQTGRFPKKSSKGNLYIMVLIHINSCGILVAAMKDRTAGKMIRAYQSLINHLNPQGIYPKHHVLDNECSAEFKGTIKKNHMTYQLVPPHDHHRNIAKKRIQTFKAHFISILCGVDKSFPLHLWCQLLPQAQHTLNLLRPAHMCPTVSAYVYLWDPHDYNTHPFAPLGCKVEAYLYPGIRETWAPHTASRYYIGNFHEHYWCHKIYIPDTRSNRVRNAVFFKHKYLTMPTITSDVALILATDKLVDAIAGVVPKNSITKDAIVQLMAIYCTQALAASNAVSAQRVLGKIAATQCAQLEATPARSQRVDNEAWMDEIEDNAANDSADTNSPVFEVDFTMTKPPPSTQSPIISQDNYDSPPSANTQHHHQGMITQDSILHVLEQASK